jgi:hypothetical protein
MVMTLLSSYFKVSNIDTTKWELMVKREKVVLLRVEGFLLSRLLTSIRIILIKKEERYLLKS